MTERNVIRALFAVLLIFLAVYLFDERPTLENNQIAALVCACTGLLLIMGIEQ